MFSESGLPALDVFGYSGLKRGPGFVTSTLFAFADQLNGFTPPRLLPVYSFRAKLNNGAISTTYMILVVLELGNRNGLGPIYSFAVSDDA